MPVSPVTKYARDVKAGRVPACSFVVQACERHLSDLRRSRRKGFPYKFDDGIAERVISGFFPNLKLTKGRQFRGKPFRLEPWQAFIVGCLFGWVEKGSGYRRFRYAYVEVPRKNGKSEMLAAIGLLLAFFDGEEGAEVYAAATKREQAKIVWGVARDMVNQSAFLKKRIEPRVGNLSSERSNSKFEPLSSDYSTMDGLNIHAALVDEVHAHKDRKLVDVLETATGSRLQPLMIEITTAGEYDPESICWKHHEYSTQLLSGALADGASERWFAYIATADEGDDWTAESTWIKANPNMGVSKSLEQVRMECERARAMPADENKFRRYHLDQWVSQEERWISFSVWEECRKPFELAELEGRPCWAGLDLAANADITALVLVFPLDGMKVFPFFWVPEESIDKRTRRERERYRDWIAAGFLQATPGEVTRFDRIRDTLRELRPRFDIRQIGIDEWNATQLATQLEDDEGFDVVLMRQGMATLAGPTKELERLIVAKELQHTGHPVLSWMFDNVSVKTDEAGNRKIVRPPERGRKVDGMVALVMGIGCYIKQRGEAGSVYADRGMLSLEWFE